MTPIVPAGKPAKPYLRNLVGVKATVESCRDGLGEGMNSNWTEYELSPNIVTLRFQDFDDIDDIERWEKNGCHIEVKLQSLYRDDDGVWVCNYAVGEES